MFQLSTSGNTAVAYLMVIVVVGTFMYWLRQK
jgi:hypothetical protein